MSKAFGAASSISYGNNRNATLSYDNTLMRLTSMEVARPNGSDRVLAYNYAYWENGLLGQVQDVLDATYLRAFEYNSRNQLTKTTGNWSQTVNTYSFDDWGNLTNRDGSSLSYATGSGSVPTTNRVTSTTYGGTTSFSYDSAGNMTAAGSTSYQWDAANRLKSVNNGSLGSYGYDGNGKRVKKTESGTTTYYVISSVLGSVMEVTSAGVQRAYVMSGSAVVAQLNPNGQFYWIHLDHLGSGRKMTDSSGTMVYRAEFDPYGKLLYEWSSPSNLNTRKFTGYERDAATNLDYAQARMYASDWGRFISVDKLGLTGARLTNPKSLNRYSYASGDPINRVDRNGLQDGPVEDWGLTMTINTTDHLPKGMYRDFGLGGQFMIQEDLNTEQPVELLSGGGQGQPPPGTTTFDTQVAFIDFLENHLPEACKTELADYLPRIKAISGLLTEYLFDTSSPIGNQLASRYIPMSEITERGGNVNTTLRAHFSYLNLNNAYTQTASPSDQVGNGTARPGIYYNGWQVFAGSIGQLLLLHEVMHLLVSPPSSFSGDLDQYFIQQFGLIPKEGETPSRTVSRFFNSGCQRE